MPPDKLNGDCRGKGNNRRRTNQPPDEVLAVDEQEDETNKESWSEILNGQLHHHALRVMIRGLNLPEVLFHE